MPVCCFGNHLCWRYFLCWGCHFLCLFTSRYMEGGFYCGFEYGVCWVICGPKSFVSLPIFKVFQTHSFSVFQSHLITCVFPTEAILQLNTRNKTRAETQFLLPCLPLSEDRSFQELWHRLGFPWFKMDTSASSCGTFPFHRIPEWFCWEGPWRSSRSSHECGIQAAINAQKLGQIKAVSVRMWEEVCTQRLLLKS